MGLMEQANAKPKHKSPIKVKYKSKFDTIPPGFKLIIDTREQQLLFTDPPDGLAWERRTVHDGDYTIEGYEHMFAVERKKMSDLYTYCTSEWDSKTERKVTRFRDMAAAGGFVGLVIEASEADVLSGYEYSRVNPNSVRGALNSFEVRYGIHVYYSRSRVDIERKVLDWAIKFYEIMQEVQSERD